MHKPNLLRDFAEKQKPALLRELCRKAEVSQELCSRSRVILKNYTLFAFFILHCAALYRFLYCIDATLYCFILIDVAPYRFILR